LAVKAIAIATELALLAAFPLAFSFAPVKPTLAAFSLAFTSFALVHSALALFALVHSAFAHHHRHHSWNGSGVHHLARRLVSGRPVHWLLSGRRRGPIRRFWSGPIVWLFGWLLSRTVRGPVRGLSSWTVRGPIRGLACGCQGWTI